MKLVHVPMIDEERIAAYIDGTLSPEEMSAFNNDMAHDDVLAAFVSDFKTDLGIVDNGISLEQHELNFDPIGAVDSLFAESNNFQVIGTDLNASVGEQVNNLDMYLGLAMDDYFENSEDDIKKDDTNIRDKHNEFYQHVGDLSNPNVSDDYCDESTI